MFSQGLGNKATHDMWHRIWQSFQSDENGIQDKNSKCPKALVTIRSHFLWIFHVLEAIWSRSSKSVYCVGILIYVNSIIFSLNVNWSDTSPFQISLCSRVSIEFLLFCEWSLSATKAVSREGGNQKTENQCSGWYSAPMSIRRGWLKIGPIVLLFSVVKMGIDPPKD